MNGCGLCSNKAKIRGVEAETAVVRQIEQQLFSDAFLQGLVDEMISLKQAQSMMADKTVLERRRQEISSKIVNLTKVAAVAPDVAEIADQLAELGRERNSIDAVLRTQQHDAPIDRGAILSKAKSRLGQTLELLRSTADMDQLRLELKKWIEAIRLDANGSLWIKWKEKAVFEALGLEPVSVNGEVGTPFAATGYLASVEAWWNLPVGIPRSAARIIGFSDMAGLEIPCRSESSGFSGFSGMSNFPAA